MTPKNITVNLDDLVIDISFEKIIEREVDKRVKAEVDKAVNKIKEELPVIRQGGRRVGNSYRTILYAQLLASGKQGQNVFVFCHNLNMAKITARATAETMNSFGIPVTLNNSRNIIEFIPTNSRIHFTTSDNFHNNKLSVGMQNIRILNDD